MVVYSCNLSIWKLGGKSQKFKVPWLHSELKASLGYIISGGRNEGRKATVDRGREDSRGSSLPHALECDLSRNLDLSLTTSCNQGQWGRTGCLKPQMGVGGGDSETAGGGGTLTAREQLSLRSACLSLS